MLILKIMETQNRISARCINSLAENEIFVFGSNLSGFHGGGAAHLAMKWGAIWGQGVGLQGKTYAVPTMFNSIDKIKLYVDDFIVFAKEHSELKFLVTEIGCGIAGWTVAEIAPLFAAAVTVENVYLPENFLGNFAK
jgi:hypothetical protein